MVFIRSGRAIRLESQSHFNQEAGSSHLEGQRLFSRTLFFVSVGPRLYDAQPFQSTGPEKSCVFYRPVISNVSPFDRIMPNGN